MFIWISCTVFYRQSPFSPSELRACGMRSSAGGSGQHLEENSCDDGASRAGKVKAVGIWLCDRYLVLSYFQSVCNANSCFPVLETFNGKGFFMTPQVSSLYVRLLHSVPTKWSPKHFTAVCHRTQCQPLLRLPCKDISSFLCLIIILSLLDSFKFILLFGVNTHYVAQAGLF